MHVSKIITKGSRYGERQERMEDGDLAGNLRRMCFLISIEGILFVVWVVDLL